MTMAYIQLLLLLSFEYLFDTALPPPRQSRELERLQVLDVGPLFALLDGLVASGYALDHVPDIPLP